MYSFILFHIMCILHALNYLGNAPDAEINYYYYYIAIQNIQYFINFPFQSCN